MSNDADTLQRYVDCEIIAAEPVYRTYNPTARNLSRRAIKDALERIDADCKSVHEFIQKVSTIEHTLRCRRATLHNFLQPVAAIPMEVLQRIFLYAVRQKKGHHYGGCLPSPTTNHYGGCLPSPITLSRVCSTWRHAAQSYPQLWTLVRLEPFCPSYAPYVRHSQGLSLEIHEQEGGYMDGRKGALRSAGVRGQITAVSLLVGQHRRRPLSDDFWEENGMSNESIERLTLVAPLHVIDPHDYGIILTRLPSLRHLFLQKFFIPLPTQLAKLVTLTLFHVDVDGLEFIDFINACSNIQELTLDEVSINWRHNFTNQQLTSLHTLSVRYPLDTASPFDCYRMPNLQYFTLSFPHTWNRNRDIMNDNLSFYEVLDNHHYLPNLRTVKDFIINTPTIKVITLEGAMKPLFYALKRLWPHSSLERDNLPGLTHLTISVPRYLERPPEHTVGIRLLIKARLEGRQAKSRPLQRLTVPRFMFEDDLNWVRSQVRELELTD
ncbi:uncharacterized protein EI90DRAFT_3121342 [Cantharellus anzutake]|uniref:uncharacterized protein n=1 Tax=Cantharellus anzutake TaxID=1750568 RepID=UPI001902E62E|nr:uncharacterized protein EI90DRAFT_3121342 [Cantharellus anzutake]KAF8333967.1 hypothetical protein EI90DRAFT_3121342 [Cantharellus anzutake]